MLDRTFLYCNQVRELSQATLQRRRKQEDLNTVMTRLIEVQWNRIQSALAIKLL